MNYCKIIVDKKIKFINFKDCGKWQKEIEDYLSI